MLRTSTAQSFNLPLSPAEDVLKFFREDLEVAYDLLPVPQDVTSDYEGLATKGTAATIQGISYLYEKEYSEAEMKFKDVIDNYGYELEQDWTKMFTNAGEFNSESILEISYSLDYRQDITTWDMLGWSTSFLMINLTIRIQETQDVRSLSERLLW